MRDRYTPARAPVAAEADAWSTLNYRFEEFQPVSMRVLAVETAHPREIVVEVDRSACGAQPGGPGVHVMDEQARMSLAGRAEAVLHPEMQLDAVAAEPAATAGCERGRLGDFLEAQHTAIEVAKRVLTADRAGQLHVMDHATLLRLPRCQDTRARASASLPSCPTARRLPQGTSSVRQMRTPSTVTLGAWRRQVVTSRRRASGVVAGDGRYRQVDRRPRPRKGPTWVNLTKPAWSDFRACGHDRCPVLCRRHDRCPLRAGQHEWRHDARSRVVRRRHHR